MAVMTHARTQATEADYNQLTGEDQERFDQVMARADGNRDNG